MSGTTSTTIAFTPQRNQMFSFNAVLDGTQYVVFAWWNIYAMSWYFTIQQPSGNVALTRLLTASPDNYSINLLAGAFFTSTLVFLASSQSFVVTS